MRPASRPLRSAVLLAAALVASACPEDVVTPPPGERAPPAGTLRLGYPEEPPSLNPVTEEAPAARDLLRPVLPSFFLVTPELRYRPYLLAGPPEVRESSGRMEVRFRIRDDARWSDGEPITTSDVAFTARVMTDPGLEVAEPDGFDHLREVVEEGPKDGVLVLEPPLASWRDLFSAGRFVLPAHLADDPEAVEGWDGGPPVAGGPFRIGRRVPGRSVELEANERFFGPDPLVRRIEVAFVPDPTTAIQLLEAGLLDAVAPMLGVSWTHRLGQLDDVEVSSAVGSALVALVVNTDSVPAARQRRGIADAIDRDRFVDVVIRDEGTVADGVLGPDAPGAAPAWSRYGEGAPTSLEVGEEISLVYLRTEVLELLARFVQSELERAGADVELVALEADVLWDRFLPEGRYDLALVEWRAGPAGDLEAWVRTPGGGPTLTGLRDHRLNRLLREADRGAGTALMEAQRRLALLAPVLPIYRPAVAMAWRDGVTGPVANPSIDGPLWNAWTWAKAAAQTEAA